MRTNSLAAAVALSDRDLLARIGVIAGREREATAELVAHLAALEMRPSAYAAQGYGSLFDYCTGALRLSEDAACNRIDAARACTRFPVILDLLAAGSLTLTSVRKLRSHLTPENHQTVLGKAANQTKEQIEALIAELAPKPDVPASVRKVPVADVRAREVGLSAQPSLLDPGSDATPTTVPTTSHSDGPSATATGDPRSECLGEPLETALPAPRTPRPIVQALAPQRYRVQFTIGQETHDRLRRVQALLRRQVPNGDPAAIFDRALRLLEDAEGKRLGFGAKGGRRARQADRNYENRIRSGTDKAHRYAQDDVRAPDGSSAGDSRGTARAGVDPALPRRVEPSRHIPTAVKRAVWWRDAGQCAFVADNGRRCAARAFLELHHIQPYAMDGPPTVGNISLRCRRHNRYEAELAFGPGKVPASPARSPLP
jgi:hypothetical protein